MRNVALTVNGARHELAAVVGLPLVIARETASNDDFDVIAHDVPVRLGSFHEDRDSAGFAEPERVALVRGLGVRHPRPRV